MSSEPRREPDPPVAPVAGACVSCGSPSAQSWDTADGRVAMCQPCAVMYGIGCP